jgi:ubiquilin
MGVTCASNLLFVHLQQLNDMGFTNASQNVRALLATAGNVHSAIEYILGGGGL